MSETAKMNPFVSVAAVAVTAVSLAGIGAMTGIIGTKDNKAPAAITVAPAPVVAEQTVPALQIPAAETPASKPTVAPKISVTPAPKPVAASQLPPKVVATVPAPTIPAVTSRNTPLPAPQYPATSDYPPAVVAQGPATPVTCPACGRVESVISQSVAGEGSGVGAVIGGVAGAVLGNQVGQGRGRKVATVAGAVGGAMAGHQIEKQTKSGKRFEVMVRMDDGSSRTFPYDNEPGFGQGDRVRVVEGRLQYN